MRLLPLVVLLAACAPDLLAPTLAIDPQAPVTADDLVLTVTEAPDLDEKVELTYRVTWQRDGADVASLADLLTVPAAETAKGQTWTAVVVGVDDKDRETPSVSVQTTIGDTGPAAVSVAITPDEAFEATTLTAVPEGSDPDGDPLTWTYTWYVNDAPVSGVDGPTLTGLRFDKNDVVGVTATGTADGVDTETVSSADIVILNTPPSVDAAAIAPDPFSVVDVLTCEPTGWSDDDDDAEDYLVAWEVDGALVSTDTALDGSQFRRGQSIVCTLTPFDGDDEGTPVSSAAVVAGNAPPSIGRIALSSTSPRTNDTVAAIAEGITDPDGDAVQVRFAWSVGGTVVHTVTTAGASSLDGVLFFSKGDAISLTATPIDASGLEGAPVIVDGIRAINTPPNAPELTIDPADPVDADVLYCAVTTPSVDADDDEVTYTFSWTVDGEAWEGETLESEWEGDTIPASATRPGQEWECAAVANDGEADGGEGFAEVVRIWAPPAVGTTGTTGVVSGNPWYVCRADTSTTWVAANTSGTYRYDEVCKELGYDRADAWGGTCGTRCGYCGNVGREFYDGGGKDSCGAGTVCFTVHWRCVR